MRTNTFGARHLTYWQYLNPDTDLNRRVSAVSCTSDLVIGAFLLCGITRQYAVGIATRYGLDGPGIESWWGWYFPHPSRPALGPTQSPIQWVPRLSRGEAYVAWHWPPTHLAPRLKGMELYLCSPSGSSWPVLGWTTLGSIARKPKTWSTEKESKKVPDLEL
jgi:hypothetical protein